MDGYAPVHRPADRNAGAPGMRYLFSDTEYRLVFTGTEPFSVPMELVLFHDLRQKLHAALEAKDGSFTEYNDKIVAALSSIGEMIALLTLTYDSTPSNVRAIIGCFQRYLAFLGQIRSASFVASGLRVSLSSDNDPVDHSVLTTTLDEDELFGVAVVSNAERLCYQLAVFMPYRASVSVRRFAESSSSGEFIEYLSIVENVLNHTANLLMLLLALEGLRSGSATRFDVAIGYSSLLRGLLDLIRSVLRIERGEVDGSRWVLSNSGLWLPA